jgi:hypothetical protein
VNSGVQLTELKARPVGVVERTLNDDLVVAAAQVQTIILRQEEQMPDVGFKCLFT